MLEEDEERHCQFVEPLQNAVELRRAEILHAGDRTNILCQFLEPVIAYRDTEILPGRVFNLVSLIENDGVIWGKNACSGLAISEAEVGKKQVVVDDDDIAFGCALVHQSQEAPLKLLAFLTRAEIGAGIEFTPCGARFRKRSNFGAVAEFRGFFPFPDYLEVRYLFEAA